MAGRKEEALAACGEAARHGIPQAAELRAQIEMLSPPPAPE